MHLIRCRSFRAWMEGYALRRSPCLELLQEPQSRVNKMVLAVLTCMYFRNRTGISKQVYSLIVCSLWLW